MTPRSPQSSPFPREQESARTNPWGGGPVASPQSEVTPSFSPPENNETLSLQCPQCRGGLKLKREHLGIEGACVQCGTPIKAVAYPTGQIGIELIQSGVPPVPPQPVEQISSFFPPQPGEQRVDASAVESVPSFANPPAEPAPLQPNQQSSSVWSPVETPDTPANSNTQLFDAPVPPPSTPTFEPPVTPQADSQQTNTQPLEPPPAMWQEPNQPESGNGSQEEAEESSWSHSSMFQTGSASTPQQQPPAPQVPQTFQGQNGLSSPFQSPAVPPPLSEPAIQNPNFQQVEAAQSPTPAAAESPFQSPPAEQAFPSSSTPLPWASQAPPELPAESPEHFQEFKAASPFDQAEEEKESAPLPQGQPEVTVASGKKNRLGGARRKSGYGLLKTLGVALLLGGLFFAAVIFTPKEKLDEAKRWAHEFVKPAIDVLQASGKDGEGESDKGTSSENQGAPLPEPAKVNGATSVQALPNSGESSESNLRAGSASSNAGNSAPVSENLRINREGGAAIRDFYSATELKSRAEFVLDRRKNLPRMEAFYSETDKLPTLKSLKFQKAVRSSESGRWFGIFEVDESDDEKIHRWIAVEDGEGGFKLDWAMYEQTINNGLQRFLDDPTAGTQEFRVSLVRGDPVPEQNNPWNSDAVGLYLKSPFDGQAARPIILRAEDFERLGLSEKLVGQTPRLARLEMAWVPSEYNRNSRVPVVTKLFGWGAW